MYNLNDEEIWMDIYEQWEYVNNQWQYRYIREKSRRVCVCVYERDPDARGSWMNIRVNYSSQVSICRFFSVSLPVEITFSSHFTERDLPMHQGRERSSPSIDGIFAIHFWIAATACARLSAPSLSIHTNLYPGKETNRGLGREKDGV